jgi:glucose/arabinose dehydrogenase
MICTVKYVALAVALSFFVAGCAAVDPEIDVTPSAGSGAAATMLLPPPVERFDGTPTRIGFEPVALKGEAFADLSDFAFLPGSGRFLAVNRVGMVALYELRRDEALMIGSFQIPAVIAGGDCMTWIAVDPDFSTNRMFYVGYCIDHQYSVIKRYEMTGEAFEDTLYTAANIIAMGDQRVNALQHALGSISFAADGTMWANVGDRKRPENAQDPVNELGKILRFVPYRNPAANGFSPPGSASAPRNAIIHASGFADPRTGAFDSIGRYWVADAGSSRFQEINVVTGPAQNFGWPKSEGQTCAAVDCTDFELPVRFWSDSPDHAYVLEDPLARTGASERAAWVGLEYVPGDNDKYGGLLTGVMLFGDSHVGFVRGAALNADGDLEKDVPLGHLEKPVAWRQGADGYVYAATMRSAPDAISGSGMQGTLWRAVPLP